MAVGRHVATNLSNPTEYVREKNKKTWLEEEPYNRLVECLYESVRTAWRVQDTDSLT